MRILYGIQGTGNGHITRARAMASEFDKAGLAVDFLVSGRPRDQLFDMGGFGDFRHRDGLTFAVSDGRIRPLATMVKARPLAFLRDIRRLELERYDLVITDYEPITAWAARLKGIPSIGLGHQYAFEYPIPQYRGSAAQRTIMRQFAPARRKLGVHWHHFNAPILPPIAPVGGRNSRLEKGLIIVYLPFESTAAISFLLNAFPEYRFSIYHPDAPGVPDGHMTWHKPQREAFQDELHHCEGVICNAGFELASEVLQLGRKLLVKPVHGQPEQYSNTLALDLLGYGHTMHSLDAARVSRWLDSAEGARVIYPNVARGICEWLAAGAVADIGELSRSLWDRAILPEITPATVSTEARDVSPELTDDNARSHAHGHYDSP